MNMQAAPTNKANLKTIKVWLDALVVSNRHRDTTSEKVSLLAESIKEIGLLTPITVRFEEDETMHLVSGLHRVRAAEKLGWEQIDAIAINMDDVDRERWEIAENLHRSELTDLQRSQQLTRWTELTLLKVRQSDAPQGGKQPKDKGIRATAKEFGLSESDVRRAVKVASLSDEAKQAAVEVGLDDNRSALLEAAKQDGPDAEVKYLRTEAARRQAEKERREAEKFNRDQNRVIEMSAAEELAQWIMANVSLDQIPQLISWLEAAKPKEIIASLRRMAA